MLQLTRIDAINLLLGPVVLYTYAHHLPAALREGVTLDYLWANIKGVARSLTTASIFVAAIAYLVVLYALRRDRSRVALAGYALFLVGAALWAPLLRYRRTAATLAALTATSVGAAVLLYRAIERKDVRPVTRWAAGYVLFHVLVLDNLHWGVRHARAA